MVRLRFKRSWFNALTMRDDPVLSRPLRQTTTRDTPLELLLCPEYSEKGAALPVRNRSNPLALAVLICLYERPMHPYEVATTLRQRQKHESVRLNYGSLYAVVESLERRGLIVPQGTERSGRLPERTIYDLTDAGRIETHDWRTDLISTPVKDYPEFEAALSFLPALPPDDIVQLLGERALLLEMEIAQMGSARELVERQGIPRLFWVETEFRMVLREAELAYVRKLASEIVSGSLEGIEWWRSVHEDATMPVLALRPVEDASDAIPAKQNRADSQGR
jgi:DNA-binding PadR family transcriptional regulator